MYNQCSVLSSNNLQFPITTSPSQATCPIVASAFYLLVRFGGANAYKNAQAEQQAYSENDPLCIAKCPTTQESGGQGITTLAIDLLRKKGTFPVSYEMYDIPDRLYIEYEGSRIFDTGDFVSGSDATNVNFSGTTSIIRVVIDAPYSGTAWDVYIGCPEAS
jgi:hypothetical protein